MESWFWILGWFLSILTITGNGFIIFLVCKKRQLRTKANAFVVSLAVADFCAGISVFPMLFLYEMTRDRNFSQELYKGVLIVRWFFQDASVMNLSSLVLERYIAIVKPFKYVTFMHGHRVVQMIFFPWAITVVYILLESSLWIGLKSSFVLKILIWFVITFFEFLPCCLVIFCLFCMLRVVYRHKGAVSILTRQLRLNHCVSYRSYENSAVVMVTVVSGIFLVCYGLYLRCGFMMVFNIVQDCSHFTSYQMPMLVFNSAFNPLAYAFFKRDIKKEIKRLLYAWTLKKQRLKNIRHCYDYDVKRIPVTGIALGERRKVIGSEL